MSTGKRADTLVEHMGRIEYFTLARLWDGLTDDELFFEPVPNMWSVRRRGESTTDARSASGSGSSTLAAGATRQSR